MINLSVVIDNDEALKKLRELQAVAKTTTSNVVSDSERMDAAMQKFKSTLMQITAGIGMMQLAKQVVQVRAEFESLEIAFGTLLGNKEKADKLMAELTELAATTPFGLQEVSQAAKQLLAFGSTAEDVSEEIVMLGDIASGLSIPLGNLIYLYGTTRAQGQLFTQDLRQFMGRGIPLAKELAEQFGVTEQEVSALVTEGKVGFEDVQKALQSLTAEGSMFGGGMQKQSEGIKGQISNIQDAIDSMFNEIGKSSDGLINMTLEGVSWVVEHWRELLNILKYVVAAYGAYKAAVIMVAATHKAMALATVAGRFIQVAKGVTTLTQAMRVLNTVVKANPLGIIASVLATVAVSFIDVAGSADDAASGIDDAGDAADNTARAMGRLEQATADARAEIDEMFNKILDPNTSQDERIKMLVKLKAMYPSIADAIDLETLATENLTEAQKKLNEELEKEQSLNRATDRKNTAQETLNAAKTEAARVDISSQVQAEIERYRNTGKLPYYDVWEGSKSAEGIAEMMAIYNEDSARKYINDIYSAVHGTLERELTAAYDAAAEGRINELQFLERIEAAKAKAEQAAASVANQVMWNSKRPADDATPGYGFGGFDIAGMSESGWLNVLRERNEALEDATTELEDATNEYNNTLSSLGMVDTNVGDEYLRRTSSFLEAYNEAKNAVAEAEANLRKAIEEDDRNRVTQFSEELKLAEENYDKIAKPYDDYLKRQERLAEEARKKREKIADANKKLMDDAAQARVDAMADGFDKEMAQLDLNYQREIRKIEEQEAEIRKLQGGKLNNEQQAAFDALRDKAVANYVEKSNIVIFGDPKDYEKQLKDAQASWDDYLAEYGTFQERLAAIKRNYERRLAEADTEGEKAAIRRERDAVLAEYEVEATGFARDLANKTLSEVEAITKQLQDEVDAKKAAYDALGSSDSAEAQALLKEIDQLNAKIKALEELTGKASDNLAKDNWEGATEVFQNIAKSAEEASQSIAEFDERLAYALNGIAQLASLSIDFIGALEGAKKAFEKTGEAASEMEKASAILAVIGVAIKAVSGIFNIMKGNEEATRNATLAAYEYAQALREIANTNLRESFDTYFGKDNFGEFSALLEETKVQAKELDDIRKSFSDTFFKGDKSIIYNPYNVEVPLIADMRSGWQKIWGTGKDNIKYTSLDEFYENGKLNVDKLKAYYDTYKEYLDEEQADLVKSLLDTGQRFEQNMEAINGYMRDIFGELGGSITDSIVDAFRNGTDAAEAMGDAVGDVFERIATDMANAAFIQPLLEEAQAAVEALNAKRSAMSDEEYMRQLMGISSELLDSAMAQGNAMNAYLANLQKIGEEYGVDIFDSDAARQSATSKGSQTISQETGSELNGRVTDIQGQVHRMAEAVEFCRALQTSHTQHLQSISSTLASIHNDTTLIASHTRALSEIRDDISTIRRSIDNGAL